MRIIGTEMMTFGAGLPVLYFATADVFLGGVNPAAVMFVAMRFRDNVVGLGMLGLFGVLEGVSLGPLVNHYLNLRGGVEIVAMSAALTGLATLACAAYCITSRRSFSRFGGFLFAALIVLIIASLVALFFPVPAVHVAISVVATLLFVGYLLYDIGEVVTGVETNYISAADIATISTPPRRFR